MRTNRSGADKWVWGKHGRKGSIAMASVLVGVCLFGAQALAAPVSIENAGFETADLSAWGFGSVAGGTTSGGALSPAEGASFFLGLEDPVETYGYWSLAQVLTGADIQPDTLYVLELDMAPATTREAASAVVRLSDANAWNTLAESVFHPAWQTPKMFNSMKWMPCPDCLPEDFDLLPGQWTTVTLRFNGNSFVSGLSPIGSLQGRQTALQIIGKNLAIDNVRMHTYPLDGPRSARSWYISASEGSDSNDGASEAAPLQTFDKLDEVVLKPGDAVYLKRGDVWDEELYLTGDGASGNPVVLTAYGDPAAPRPCIQRGSKDRDRCIVLESPSYWNISEMDCRHGMIGLYLRYTGDYNNQDVHVSDCYFEEFDARDDGTIVVEPQLFRLEYPGNVAIFAGGSLQNSGTVADEQTVLDGWIIERCEIINVNWGIGCGYWYYSSRTPFGRFKNLTITDSVITACTGGLSIFAVEGGAVDRLRIFERSGKRGNYVIGNTNVIMTRCRDMVFQDCEFAENDRMLQNHDGGDGFGFDMESSEYITLRDCVFHNNDGIGMGFLSTEGPNTNITIEDCTMYNNGLDAGDYYGGNAWEFKLPGYAIGEPSYIRNCGMYVSDKSAWLRSDLVGGSFFEDLRFGWYAGYPNVRSDFPYDPPAPTWADSYPRLNEDVGTRPDFWDSDSEWGQWGDFNDWDSPAVSGGVLSGAAGAGGNPYAQSPPLFINSHRHPYIRLSMRTTADPSARVYFIKETDSVWDVAKSAVFTTTPDGNFNEYLLDMRALCGQYTGVVTQLRVQPAVTPGTEMGIDWLRFEPDPIYKTEPVPDANQFAVENWPKQVGANILEFPGFEQPGSGGTYDAALVTGSPETTFYASTFWHFWNSGHVWNSDDPAIPRNGNRCFIWMDPGYTSDEYNIDNESPEELWWDVAVQPYRDLGAVRVTIGGYYNAQYVNVPDNHISFVFRGFSDSAPGLYTHSLSVPNGAAGWRHFAHTFELTPDMDTVGFKLSAERPPGKVSMFSWEPWHGTKSEPDSIFYMDDIYIEFRGFSDGDGDGLDDEWETMDLDPFTPGVQNPFDPNDPDTTGDNGVLGADGIPDGQNDWDGDGVSNETEFDYGWNPADPLDPGAMPAAGGFGLLALALLLAFAARTRAARQAASGQR